MKNLFKALSIVVLFFSLMVGTAYGVTIYKVSQGGTGVGTFPTGECLIGNGTGNLTTDPCATGTVTSISQGTGILLSANPIVSTGSVSLATSLQPAATLAGNSLKYLRVNAGETAVEYATVASSTPGGSDTQVQFNDAGAFGGDAGFTYNKTTDTLTLAGGLSSATLTAGAVASGTTKALIVNNGTSSGNIFEAQDNGTAVFTVADGGNATFTAAGRNWGPAIAGAIIEVKSSAYGSTNGLYLGETSANRPTVGAGAGGTYLQFQGGTTGILFTNNALSSFNGMWSNAGNLFIGGATAATARLEVDNNAVAQSIFVAKDNGSAVFTIADGGNTTYTAVLIGSTQALTGAGAANVTTETTKITTSGVLDAISLADGVNGQTKTVLHDVDGGSFVLTPTTKTGWSTFTSTVVGESITLRFVTTRGWIVIGSYLGTIAP